MITVKVWQLMLAGGALVAMLAFLAMQMLGGGTPAGAVAAKQAGLMPAQQSQLTNVTTLVPALDAWKAKHGTYKGFKNPAGTVTHATAATYCLEATGPFPHVFKNGPAAQPMLGTCANPAAGRPVS